MVIFSSFVHIVETIIKLEKQCNLCHEKGSGSTESAARR